MAGNTPGPDPGNGGRPRKEITQKTVDNMIKILCTRDEILAVLDIADVTLASRIKEWTGDPDMTFLAYYKQKREGAKMSLRRKQWKLADKNVAMAIFLGKNYLDQKDTKEVKASFDPLQVDVRFTKEDEEAYNKRMAEFMGEDTDA